MPLNTKFLYTKFLLFKRLIFKTKCCPSKALSIICPGSCLSHWQACWLTVLALAGPVSTALRSVSFADTWKQGAA